MADDSTSFQAPDPDRSQRSTAPSDPALIRAALGHKPNTGTRPDVTPVMKPVRGQSYSKDPTYVNHSVKVDQALDDAGA